MKFHLDKLVAAGLLEVEYRRLTGRTGPGAGRRAKLYRRSDREVALSVPPRRYDLAADEGGSIDDEISRTSRVLGRHGYEPIVEEELCLANRPFDRLASDHADPVCGLDLALIYGVVDGLKATTLAARLAPEPGLCSVRVAG